jgi:hypothetical protein
MLDRLLAVCLSLLLNAAVFTLVLLGMVLLLGGGR